MDLPGECRRNVNLSDTPPLDNSTSATELKYRLLLTASGSLAN